MAVELHNSTFTAGPVSAGSRTLLHTATAGSVLLVWTHTNTATSLSAVAAGANALTRIGAVSASASRAEVWALTAPPSGVLTISAIPAGTTLRTWCIAATTYVNHRTTATPFGTVVGGSASGSTSVFSVSSTVADVVAFSFGISANATVTINTGVTRADTTHSTTGRMVVGDIYGAPTVSISASSSVTGIWSFLGVPIIASAIAAPVVKFDNAAISGDTSDVNNRGLLLTATSGAVLLVFAHIGANLTTSAMAVGGTPMTLLQGTDYRHDFGIYRVEMWGLTAPPSGVLTISSTLAGAGVADGYLAAMTFTGQRTNANPFGGVVVTTASVTASISLVISSTANNRVAMLFGGDEVLSVVPERGVTSRKVTGAGPVTFIIADAPGATNVTATAFVAASTVWGGIGINIIASATSTNISGIAAMTDIRDSLSAVGYVVVRGLVSATNALDTFVAPTKVIVRGLAAFTDVTDTLSSAAKVRISGRLSATDVVDTLAASGYLLVRSTLAATDAADSFAATGQIIIRGTVAATDAPDIFAASGYAVGGTITGSVNATDAPDTLSTSAQVIVSGNVIATDAPDTLAATGSVLGSVRSGDIVATDVPDSFAATGQIIVQGLAAFTDTPDTFVALANNISESAAVVTILQDLGSGGGGKNKKPPYIRAPEDFWAVRERHLKRLQPEMVESAEPVETPVPDISPVSVSPQLISYRVERASVIEKLKTVDSPPKLYNRTKRLKQLNANIAEQKRLHLLEQQRLAEQLRLEKVRRKRARARKLKKAIKLLAIARALSTLTYIYSKL